MSGDLWQEEDVVGIKAKASPNNDNKSGFSLPDFRNFYVTCRIRGRAVI